MAGQTISSNGLLGLSHYRNSRVSMALYEPSYNTNFTVQISLPSSLSVSDQTTNMLLEEVTKVDGLDTNKVPGVVTQHYKYATRSFANGKPEETSIDVKMDFEVNLRYDTIDGTPSCFTIKTLRAWTDLIYDPLTGRQGLKKDYVADQAVVTQQDRAGTPYRQWILYNIFPTTSITPPTLDYNSAEIYKITGFNFRCDYFDEVQV